jgi:hypothetical protein
MNNVRNSAYLAALGSLVLSAAACTVSADDDRVKPSAELIDRTKSAITASGLWYVNGTYGSGCKGHSGGEGWSLAIGANPAKENALWVAKNNDACVLTVASTERTDGGGATTTYTAASGIALTNAWKGASTAFSSGGSLQFYANAKLDTSDYSTNFALSFLVSDSSSSEENLQSRYASFAVSSDPQTVAPPNYSVSFGNFALGVDAAKKVTDISGTIDLVRPSSGAVQGSAYVISQDPELDETFASLDAEFSDTEDADQTVLHRGTITADSNPALDSADFGMPVDFDLTAPAVRWVIVKRSVSSVVSYQAFKITFTAPSN